LLLLLAFILASCDALKKEEDKPIDSKNTVTCPGDSLILARDGGASSTQCETVSTTNPLGFEPVIYGFMNGSFVKLTAMWGMVAGQNGPTSIEGFLSFEFDPAGVAVGTKLTLTQVRSDVGFNMGFTGSTDGDPTSGDFFGSHDPNNTVVGQGSVTVNSVSTTTGGGNLADV